jgi:hypothetical protein
MADLELAKCQPAAALAAQHMSDNLVDGDGKFLSHFAQPAAVRSLPCGELRSLKRLHSGAEPTTTQTGAEPTQTNEVVARHRDEQRKSDDSSRLQRLACGLLSDGTASFTWAFGRYLPLTNLCSPRAGRFGCLA